MCSWSRIQGLGLFSQSVGRVCVRGSFLRVHQSAVEWDSCLFRKKKVNHCHTVFLCLTPLAVSQGYGHRYGDASFSRTEATPSGGTPCQCQKRPMNNAKTGLLRPVRWRAGTPCLAIVVTLVISVTVGIPLSISLPITHTSPMSPQLPPAFACAVALYHAVVER